VWAVALWFCGSVAFSLCLGGGSSSGARSSCALPTRRGPGALPCLRISVHAPSPFTMYVFYFHALPVINPRFTRYKGLKTVIRRDRFTFFIFRNFMFVRASTSCLHSAPVVCLCVCYVHLMPVHSHTSRQLSAVAPAPPALCTFDGLHASGKFCPIFCAVS
jgi:hypothetical protein